jgi:hypothetical protein
MTARKHGHSRLGSIYKAPIFFFVFYTLFNNHFQLPSMALLIGVQGELHLERQSWFHAVGKGRKKKKNFSLLVPAHSLAFCGTVFFCPYFLNDPPSTPCKSNTFYSSSLPAFLFSSERLSLSAQ